MAAFLVTAVQTPALAATKYFKLINRSGSTVTAIYCTASGSGNWGGNRLSGSLYNGGSVGIPVNTNRRQWDFLVVFANGRQWDCRSVDVVSYDWMNIP